MPLARRTFAIRPLQSTFPLPPAVIAEAPPATERGELSGDQWGGRQVRRDLVLIGLATAALFALLLLSHEGEPLASFAVTGQLSQLNEMLAALALSAPLWVVFAARRVGDLRRGLLVRDQAAAHLRHLALHDPLTGLPNRLLFSDHLTQEIARLGRNPAATLAVLCLDLDRFKQVNDVFGHLAGDTLLQQVADRLSKVVRRTDILARFGGDEFAIVQPAGAGDGTHPHAAAILARRLVEAIAEPFYIDGEPVIVGVSIGISISKSDQDHPQELIRAADIALYRSKANGRSQYCFFEPAMDAELRRRQDLERDLRLALAADTLALNFQPLFDLDSGGRITGFEALLRWRHPQRGDVTPGEFIPIAEETGLILKLGDWVLAEACRQAATWPKPLGVAVNLSSIQFAQHDLVDTVVRVLEETGLSPERLELEITETALLRNTEETLGVLRELKGLGVRIAMDDFGTGYSSLSYLRRFPFDKIKIDQSFIRGLGTSEDDASIVRAVIALGRSLGVVPTAEGVETPTQLQFLRAQGCSEVQGFLIGRPLPADAVAEFITENRQVSV
jgi:diguanylate cyclase (GGDEF)-like protein